jgi:hypothetical protein
MDITFTLQAGFSGTQADDFNISGVTSSGTNTLLASGITKAQLATGYTINADPTITGGTITSTGVCTNSINWLTFGSGPTSYDCINGECVEVQGLNGVYSDLNDCQQNCSLTYYEYTGSGYGNSVQGACDDSSISNGGLGRTLYSDCASFEFGQNCYVYSNNSGNALVGYTHVFINDANWDISSLTGMITGLSSTQC